MENTNYIEFCNSYIEYYNNYNIFLKNTDSRLADALINFNKLNELLDDLNTNNFSELEKKKNIIINDECYICLEQIGSSINIINTSCNHDCHMVCLIKSLMFNNTCPICRKIITKLFNNDISYKIFQFMCVFKINIDLVILTINNYIEEIKVLIKKIKRINNKKTICERIFFYNNEKKLSNYNNLISDKLRSIEYFTNTISVGINNILLPKIKNILGDNMLYNYCCNNYNEIIILKKKIDKLYLYIIDIKLC